MAETGALISRLYSNFLGCDMRGDEVNLRRSPDSLNVWKDYKNTESIRTRPNTELVAEFSDGVNGIYFYSGIMIVHSGTRLYAYNERTKIRHALYDKDNRTVSVADGKSQGVVFGDKFYFKDGTNYLVYDGEYVAEVEGYIPTTSIGRRPSGGGTIYEDVNLLSPYRINTFLADGEKETKGGVDYYKYYYKDACKNTIPYWYNSTATTKLYNGVWEAVPTGEYEVEDGKLLLTVGEAKMELIGVSSTEYFLDAQEIDEDYPPIIKINDKEISEGYEVDYDTGKITFNNSPLAPDTDGRDNVWVKFRKTVEGYPKKIKKSTMLQVFDNRIFFCGNPDEPNVVRHCALNDPTYCSDLDYYNEGTDKVNIRGLVAGNNALWAFREPSEANTTVFYHVPTIDGEYGKIYPSSHSSISIGCIGGAINFNDDIVFFSDRGMEGISGDITSEQIIGHRSTLVDRKLTAEKNYKDMLLEEWEGYLFVFIGNKVYLADSRGVFTNENHIEYEWFYWELDKDITCVKVNDGVMYLGTDDGVYSLTDTEGDVVSYWVTPKDKFGAPHKLKTTNKRGCVVESTTGTPENNYEGEISVYAKLEDTDFEFIGTYNDVSDYFVSRIKRKKFKDIQLKFYSEKRFSLETASLECFVGGYIKR